MPKRKKPLRPVNRFTLTMASRDDVEQAHRELSGISSLEVKPIDVGAFLFADLDRNWWEIRT